MALLVVAGAKMSCSFGAAPSTLAVAVPTYSAGNKPIANINDHIPNSNIPPFGMCNSMQNPQVQTATAAALGVLMDPETGFPALLRRAVKAAADRGRELGK